MFEFYPLSHSARTCISLHSTLEKNPVSTFYLSRVERKSENISFTVFKFDLEYLLAPQSYHVNYFHFAKQLPEWKTETNRSKTDCNDLPMNYQDTPA